MHRIDCERESLRILYLLGAPPLSLSVFNSHVQDRLVSPTVGLCLGVLSAGREPAVLCGGQSVSASRDERERGLEVLIVVQRLPLSACKRDDRTRES